MHSREEDAQACIPEHPKVELEVIHACHLFFHELVKIVNSACSNPTHFPTQQKTTHELQCS
jgi:hypothetical protein